MVKVPDLRSVSLIQARSEIESNNLKIGKIKYEPSSYDNLVIEQKIDGENVKPGTSVPAGTRIDLVVGQKQGSDAVVPNLIGLTRDNAAFKAAEHSTNIGKIYYDNTVTTNADTALSVIWKQSLRAGIIVGYGAEIDIWLTTEPNKY